MNLDQRDVVREHPQDAQAGTGAGGLRSGFSRPVRVTPLQALEEMGVKLDADTRAELEGKRFSEFWAARRKAVEGPVEVRDLPPGGRALDDEELESVAGRLGR